VHVTPTDVPPDSEESYYSVARRIADETGGYYPDQYNNLANAEAHYLTTAQEIWDQTNGDFDVLIAGIGTGGTISGIGKFLKERSKDIKVVGVDPEGSVIASYFASGRVNESHVYAVEGIGEDFVGKAIDFSVIDEIVTVSDRESFDCARRLAKEEGIFAGGSSGAAIAGALRYIDFQSKPLRILVILPDSGSMYLSKFYCDDWMKNRGFEVSAR
jgi:cystathionine beta-synthase